MDKYTYKAHKTKTVKEKRYFVLPKQQNQIIY